MTRIGGEEEGAGRPADDGSHRRKSRHLETLPGISFAELIDVLQIPQAESISLCHRPVGGRFFAGLVAIDQAAKVVATHPVQGDWWFGPNPVRMTAPQRSGRGRESDVRRWSAFNFDLDVKAGCFENLAQAEVFIDVFADKTGLVPAALIYSGHGLQPIYAVDEPLDDTDWWTRACRDSRQVGRLAAQFARDFCGAAIDTVSDLNRVVRVPGTTNFKDPHNPMPTFAVRYTGRPLGLLAIEDILAGLEVFEIASDEPVFEEIISDCEDWDFGDQDCQYVISMVCAWDQDSDRPRAGRHPWALGKAVRLAAAHRLGCLTQDGLYAALEHLNRSLEHWCSTVGDPRPLHHDEIGSVYRWAMRKVATFDDERTRQELGGHQHGSWWSAW